ncbi:MAG: lysine--tRNA ligase [Clostridia bacterium]|nr:lysine--tRNA ligase [Clostridia bacterium]
MPEEDLVRARREKLARLRAAGVDPFGRAFPVTAHAAEIHGRFADFEGREVKVAGRLMAERGHGRVAFADLQDQTGRIQLYLKADETAGFADLLPLLDLGDWVGAEGIVTRTRRGEESVLVRRLTLLCKSLRPLPDKWAGLRDPDLRQRLRYLDLAVNPETRRVFLARSRVVGEMRRFLEARGFVEVETPILTPLAGGAAARPFVTHHRALDMPLYLRIATELYLKRLVVGGFERVYEIGRVFRNEGVDRWHNPEFTMMECYEAFGDLESMMELTESMVAAVAERVTGATEVVYQGRRLDFRPPWRRLSMLEALADLGLGPAELRDDEAVKGAARRLGVELEPGADRGRAIDAIVSQLVQPELVQPTFLLDHPVEISPLAKERPDRPGATYRFEVVVAGMELANAFSELNDPDEQRRRFEAQLARRAKGDEEVPAEIDEDFLLALEHGLPPTGGLGVGVDRLVMLLTDRASIRDVILFPLVRPEG